MPRHVTCTALCLGAALLGLPRSAHAHALGVEVSVRGDKVQLEAFFDDDTAAAHARVEVIDALQKSVATGKTDAKGLWSFPRPAPGKYRVVVDAGAGHVEKRFFTVPSPTAAASKQENPAPPAAGDAKAVTVSEGPSRAEFTRFPWLKLGIGLGAIAIFTVGFLIARTRQNKQPPFAA